MNVLIIGVVSLGDAVMSLPAVAYLKGMYPDARLEVFASNLVSEIYKHAGLELSVTEYPQGLNSLEIIKKIKTLYYKKIDKVYILPGGFVWALAARVAKIPAITGARSDLRSFLLTEKYKIEAENIHQVESYLRAVGFGAIKENELPIPEIVIDDNELTITKDKFSEVFNDDYFVVNPSSSVQYKSWHIERFIDLCDEIIKMTNLKCIIVGCKNDIHINNQLFNSVQGDGVFDLTGKTSIIETASILQFSRFVIGNNSGIVHVASAVGTPAVCISGPSNLKKNRPLGKKNIIIGNNWTKTIKKNLFRSKVHKSLDRVTVEEVIGRLKDVDFFR